MPIPEIPSEVDHTDPEQEAKELFANLLHPIKPKAFFENYWLKKPLHVKRKNKDYYKEDDWFSTDELDRILSEACLLLFNNWRLVMRLSFAVSWVRFIVVFVCRRELDLE